MAKRVVSAITLVALVVVSLGLSGCAQVKSPLGSEENPIKLYFVPSVEVGVIVESGEQIADFIQSQTGYHFEVTVPTTYAAVIEELGAAEQDAMAFIPAFGYVLAHDKYDTEVSLATVRYGWAYFADNMATPGVVDPVAVPYDGENWDGEPAGALNPFSVPAGYPSPYTARDPNDGTLTLTPPPQVAGEVVLTNGGAASAGPFAGQVANAPVVADIPFALTKTAPPETCADVNHDGDFNDPNECPGGSGTINYLTGAFDITFSTPVPMGTDITADYSYADPLFPFVASKSIVTLGISTASNEANVATSPFPGDVSCYNSYGTIDDLQPGTGIMGPYDQTTGALSAAPSRS